MFTPAFLASGFVATPAFKNDTVENRNIDRDRILTAATSMVELLIKTVENPHEHEEVLEITKLLLTVSYRRASAAAVSDDTDRFTKKFSGQFLGNAQPENRTPPDWVKEVLEAKDEEKQHQSVKGKKK